MGKKKKFVSGYRYYLGMHLALCQEADSINEILVGDRQAWESKKKPVAGNQRIHIDKPELFGGKKREGGVVGSVDVEFGGVTQNANDYLLQQHPDHPAYRGILGLIFRRVHLSSNNPYIKPIAVRAQRYFYKWQADNAQLPNGANPAHILYECLSNQTWGLGYPDTHINNASFAAAADILTTEKFGLNFIWARQSSIEEFVQMVLDHIDGALSVSPATGEFTLKLIRDDYEIDELPQFNPDNIVSLDNYQRAAIGETINEIVVTYTKQQDFEATSLAVQNLANIQAQGGIVSQTNRYPGITDPELAGRVAIRDLRLSSSQLAKARLLINRDAWRILPGEVFRLNWRPLGIDNLVMRVAEIDTGTLDNGTIAIEAIEDVFALPVASYVTPQSTLFTDPIPEPVKPTSKRLIEASYWEIATTLTAADLQYIDETSCFLQAVVARPATGHYDYTLYIQQGNTYEEEAEGSYCPIAILDTNLNREVTSTAAFTGALDLTSFEIGDHAYINDEAVRVDNINFADSTISITRGVLDTVPATHNKGATIWFVDGFLTTAEVEYANNETANAKITTFTGKGELPLDQADTDHIKMTGRQHRPYPPGNFRINNQSYPTAPIAGDLSISWSHRNRLTQTERLRPQSDGNITPEPNTTYRIKIYHDNSLVHTSPDLTDTNYTYSGHHDKPLRITLESIRDNTHSWQVQETTITRPDHT